MIFSNIIGHDFLKKKLQNYIGIPSAYIFYGPPSIGKRTIATEIAKYSLCQEKKEDECTCNSCKNFYSQGHPDFLEIGRNGKVLVGDIDEIISFVSRAPLCSKNKVVIIDNADIITLEASNRLLKTLEESSYLFFLITSQIKHIIPTIRSRCLKIPFETISQDNIANILWKKMGFDLAQARALGWIGAGSSIDILSNAGSYLKYQEVSVSFINKLLSKDFIGVLDFIDSIPKNELIIFTDVLVLVFTDILMLSYSMEEIVNSDLRQDLLKISKLISNQSLLVALNILSQVKKHSYLNINMNQALKSALIKVKSILEA